MKYLKSAVYKKSETVHKLLKYKIVAQILMLICFFKKEGIYKVTNQNLILTRQQFV